MKPVVILSIILKAN